MKNFMRWLGMLLISFADGRRVHWCRDVLPGIREGGSGLPSDVSLLSFDSGAQRISIRALPVGQPCGRCGLRS